MNILITASTFPLRLDDGSPRFVYDLAESLSEHAAVSVLAPHAPGSPRNERIGSVDVRRFRYFFPPKWQLLTPGDGRGMRERMRDSWLAKFQVAPFLLSQALMTRRLVRQLSVDVINAQWLVPQGLTAAWAVTGIRNQRPLIVLHVHAGDVYLLRKLRIGRQIARYVVSRCGYIFADGSHVRDSLDELLGYPSGAQLQPMGVHSDVFGPTGDESSNTELAKRYPGGFLLSVGRFVEKKGTIYLVRAMPKVLDSNPDIGLVLIGDGPERAAIEREIESLGLGHKVQLLGKLPHAEIIEYLQQCRLAVVPSIIDSNGETEGMPTVVLEAMAAGVGVVGSAVDGIPDVIRDRENGWLCREKDPQDLAAKIVSALEIGPRSVVSAALATARKHDWEQVARNYASVTGRLGRRLPQ